ncbi:unnamed protein product [Fraxinus pennsylvanica]|uniref:Protein kinase domain-containing protein n=1 Tax=Fraxinus pennsylvanica TaxID=56036 RepID=A0AAD1YVD6_9LAMI|nr:unnamed protein product [Fraxinus pennsylvanica]
MGVVLLGLSLMLYFWKREKNVPKGRTGGSISKDFELPLIDLPTISKATNNFSINNKLGQGGYGVVYKGTLEDGQDIAVKSLDFILFDQTKNFGLARSFGGNETGAMTGRVVGTHGYMSPEYVVEGLFSLKSDVFSFGVLVLEIVSGKKNWGFSHSDHKLNLLGHAWILYKEGRSHELVDTCPDGSQYLNEVLRSIHVGLLCVQKCPGDRPNMSTVVFMLGNGGVLPEAKQPGFFTERDVFPAESSTSTNAVNSSHEMTITLPEGR